MLPENLADKVSQILRVPYGEKGICYGEELIRPYRIRYRKMQVIVRIIFCCTTVRIRSKRGNNNGVTRSDKLMLPANGKGTVAFDDQQNIIREPLWTLHEKRPAMSGVTAAIQNLTHRSTSR